MNTIQKLALLTAGLTASLAVMHNDSAIAVTISYEFEVSVDSGPLLNETYSGSFSFDDATLTSSGSESLAISTLEFNFQETVFTEANASGGDRVRFLDDEFLGLSFSPEPSFAFIPGFLSVDEAFFAYDIAQGAGAGDINYSLQQKPPIIPVSEPHSIAGILTLGLWGAIHLLRHQS